MAARQSYCTSARFTSISAVTQAPYCLSANAEVNVRLLSRSDVKASPAPSDGDGVFSFVRGSTPLSCHATFLINMHDMQEFTEAHLHKLVLYEGKRPM